jgi:glutamate dehydrogenase/leucine dehydrogenase
MAPTVNEKILKFLAFEQTFKNSLTGLPMGGANIYTTNKVSSLQSQLNNTSYNNTTNLLVA